MRLNILPLSVFVLAVLLPSWAISQAASQSSSTVLVIHGLEAADPHGPQRNEIEFDPRQRGSKKQRAMPPPPLVASYLSKSLNYMLVHTKVLGPPTTRFFYRYPRSDEPMIDAEEDLRTEDDATIIRLHFQTDKGLFEAALRIVKEHPQRCEFRVWKVLGDDEDDVRTHKLDTRDFVTAFFDLPTLSQFFDLPAPNFSIS
ncbi:hypothetical protein EV360DRAFT_89646 [Lentinula raphanica]|nr:hypothetical protein EV360DRAFT_89646 [Lentinula raphanica]